MFLVVPVTLQCMGERSRTQVGELVTQRRLDMGLSEKQLMDLADVDRKTLGAFLDGTRWPQEDTRFKFERALRWALGTIEKAKADASWMPEGLPEPVNPLETIPDEELAAEFLRRMRGARSGLDSTTQQNASSKAVEVEEAGFDEDDLTLPPPEIHHVPETTTILPDVVEDGQDAGGFGGGPGAGRNVDEGGPDAAAQR